MPTHTIAIVSDTHADERSRWDEHCRVMDWIVADMAARNVNLTIHAGDIYEGTSTPRERDYVQRWCSGVCESSPLIIVGGNHEQEGDVTALGRLRTNYPICATERPIMEELAGVVVAALPWPRKAELLARIGRAVPTHESDAVAAEELRTVLRGFSASMHAAQERDQPTILAAHALVDGCVTDHDQPLAGLALSITIADLALSGAASAALGHIHEGARNAWQAPIPAVYCGSPRHCNYGEPGPHKGYVLAHYDGARFLGWERVATPCRPMILISGRYSAGAIRFNPPADRALVGADVRLRYKVRTEERAAAAVEERSIRAALLAMGAAHVRIEADPVTIAVARSPEVARAESTEMQLLAMWEMRGMHPPDERAELLCMLAEIEDAAA